MAEIFASLDETQKRKIEATISALFMHNQGSSHVLLEQLKTLKREELAKEVGRTQS